MIGKFIFYYIFIFKKEHYIEMFRFNIKFEIMKEMILPWYWIHIKKILCAKGVFRLKSEFVGISGSGFTRMWEGSVKCLIWDMLEWIYEESLLEFLSNVIVCERILNYFNVVKCYFTNLPLPIKKLIMKWVCFCLKINNFHIFINLKIIIKNK